MNDEYSVPPGPVALEPAPARPPGPTNELAVDSPAGAGTATLATRDRRTATLARIGLLGIGAAALVAVAVLALGSSLAPSRTLANTGSSGTTGAEDIGLLGGPGFGRGHAVMFGGITITAINGNDLSLETEDDWTRTITVDDGTEYWESGDEIGLADLAVGDRIAFRQTLEDDDTWTIDAIAVILPRAGGEVTAVDGSTITVERRDGDSTTITVTGDTELWVNGDEATLADVEVGMVLVAEGAQNADGSLTATKVRAADAHAFFGGPGFGPGRHGMGFGSEPGFGPGFHWNGEDPDATTAPEPDASAS
jgi:Domain of unknown function (DUF5666)